MTLPFTKLVLDEVKKTMEEQDEFGLKKYGVPLNPHDPQYDWLEMAQQELADGLKYFIAEKVRRNQVVLSVLNDLETLKRSVTIEQNKHMQRYVDDAIEKIKILL